MAKLIKIKVSKIFSPDFIQHVEIYENPKVIGPSHVWVPPTDVYETKGNIIVKVEVPGVNKKDINIRFAGENLVISGERIEEQKSEEKIFHEMEISYGPFEKAIYLGSIKIDTGKIEANYKDGFLEIILPKTTAKTLLININEKQQS
jgi:HSP20 family protein